MKVETRPWVPRKFTGKELLEACEKARQDEREACAKVAEGEVLVPVDLPTSTRRMHGAAVARAIAQAIRARGEKDL